MERVGSTDTQADVVVVGAGLAGLIAARGLMGVGALLVAGTMAMAVYVSS